jgi:hypothetical protein
MSIGADFDELALVAFHEAGHAVAACRCGNDDIDAEVIFEDGCYRGQVVSDAYVGGMSVGHHLVVLCSGYAALRAQEEPDEYARRGCDQDFAAARSLIAETGTAQPLTHWIDVAVRMLKESANLEAVSLIAEYLVDHRAMPRDLLALALEVADGTCSRSEFDATAKSVRHQTG